MADADARAVTRALGGRWHGGYGVARCPAHDDRSPSLSLRDGHTGRLLVCCHAGCEWRDIENALRGLGLLPGRREWTPVGTLAQEERARAEQAEAARRARQARRCWETAGPVPGTLAERYLRGRGIAGPLPSSLRFHPACWHGPTAMRHPALVARVQGAEVFGLHRTYLSPDGAKALLEPAKMMLGATHGGAVRLARGPGPLVVAEGIETALSLAARPRLVLGPGERAPSVWAALSTAGMAGLVLSERRARGGRLVVAADGDAAGRKAAQALAERARAAGWQARVAAAPEGWDWNDALREAKGEAARLRA